MFFINKYKKIVDEDFIKKTFKCASKNSNSFIYLDDNKNLLKLNFKVKNTIIYLDYKNILKSKTYEASLILNNVYILFELNVENGNKANIPDNIKIDMRRDTVRLKLKDNSLKFFIDNNEYKLYDISIKGLAFISDRELDFKNIYYANLIINKIKIYFYFSIVRCTLKDNKFIYGVFFYDINWEDRKTIFDYISLNLYKNIYDIKKYPIEEIFNLFKSSKFIIFNNKEEEKKAFKEMKSAQNKVSDKNRISFSPVYGKDKILVTANLLRIYNNTFLGQHLMSTKESRRFLNSKSDIYLNLLDYIALNDSYKFYLAYYDTENPWNNHMYDYYNKLISDSNLFYIDRWNLFDFNIKEYNENLNTYKYQCEFSKEPKNFIEYCDKYLEKIEKDCYCYNKNNFYLDDIKEIYRTFGIKLERNLFYVYYKKNLVAFVIAEVFSERLNMTNLLDNVKIYELENLNYNDVLKSIIPKLNSFYKKYSKENYKILIKSQDKNQLANFSFKELEITKKNAGRLIMNKSGILMYRNLISSNIRHIG